MNGQMKKWKESPEAGFSHEKGDLGNSRSMFSVRIIWREKIKEQSQQIISLAPGTKLGNMEQTSSHFSDQSLVR